MLGRAGEDYVLRKEGKRCKGTFGTAAEFQECYKMVRGSHVGVGI